MKAARIHDYNKPIVLEDIPVSGIQPDEILVNVKACGMCRSDVQLVDGYFRPYADIPRLEEWPELFTDDGIYEIVPKENADLV